MKATSAVLASYAPALAFALVGNSWEFTTAPSGGLSDITFGFNIANAPHESGFYFAQQFNFNGISEVGYTGLQPRPDASGNSIVHGVFSSFQNGTTTTNPNCSNGADGGAGVSCAVEIDGDYSHTYNLVVENTSGTTWQGSLVDTVTGDSTVVGEWTLPTAAGKLVNGQVGFVEYYPWNSETSYSCSSLPKTEATFYNPTSQTQGVSGGMVDEPYEYGNCIGEAGFSTTQVANGWDIVVGF